MSDAVLVLDSWAVLAFLRGEGEAALAVRRLLRRARAGNVRLLLGLVNLGEVYYRLIQLVGRGDADEKLAMVRSLPIDVSPVREPLVLEAARLKACHPLSYADSFAVALGQAERAPVVTGDPEILSLPRAVVATRRLVR